MPRINQEKKIKEIAYKYFAALNSLSLTHLSSGDNDPSSPFQKYFEDVEKAYSYLSPTHKTLINKEFFYEDYPNWWMSLYSSYQFKKLKKEAIWTFLRYFYEIH